MSKSILECFGLRHDKSQEVRKSVSETEIIPTTAESISDSSEIEQDLFEADRDNLLTDTRLSLHESTSGLSDLASETNHSSVTNDSVELTGNQSHSEDWVSNPESSDVLQVAIGRSRKIKYHEKYELITSSQSYLGNNDLDTAYFTVSGGRKRKQISFQKRWLEDYKWLCYGLGNNQGGWFLPCILFLTENEKTHLAAFVCTPFKNYNKSKELMERHAKHGYHLRAVECAFEFTQRWVNPESRIESQIIDKNSKNFNFEVLPAIVETVLLCAKQRIALQANHQDKVDFTQEPLRNEGNFIAILRLLAKNNEILNEHLMLGQRNAKYTSKIIQNEILQIAADQVRAVY